MTRRQAMDRMEKARTKLLVPVADLFLGRLMSKKLLVFFIATLFILFKHIEGSEWIEVAKWYFGAQGAVDVTKAFTGEYKQSKTESDIG